MFASGNKLKNIMLSKNNENHQNGWKDPMIHGPWVIDKPDNEEHNGTNDEKYNNDWHEENQSSPESNVF